MRDTKAQLLIELDNARGELAVTQRRLGEAEMLSEYRDREIAFLRRCIIGLIAGTHAAAGHLMREMR